MLSYQHNSIQAISRLEQLPQLTILDMYSNSIQSLHGLPRVPALRGLMLGRNYLTTMQSQEVSSACMSSLLSATGSAVGDDMRWLTEGLACLRQRMRLAWPRLCFTAWDCKLCQCHICCICELY